MSTLPCGPAFYIITKKMSKIPVGGESVQQCMNCCSHDASHFSEGPTSSLPSFVPLMVRAAVDKTLEIFPKYRNPEGRVGCDRGILFSLLQKRTSKYLCSFFFSACFIFFMLWYCFNLLDTFKFSNSGEWKCSSIASSRARLWQVKVF